MSQGPAYKPPTMYPDIVIKLGLEKAENDPVFRRITSYQLKEKDDPIQVLKTQAVLLSLSTCEEPEHFRLEDHSVALTYWDSDGDKVLINSRDDLLAAMREHFTAKKLKVMATVQKNERTPPSRARLTSVESATQTTSAANSETPSTRGQPHHLPVHDVVDAILGILAGAASAVQAHLQEATATDRRVETATSTTAPPVVTDTSPPSVTTTEATTQAPPSARSSTRYCLDDKEEDEAAGEKEETDAREEKKEDARPFIHGRHTCDGCLTTPIVGKRFHAVNLPDYDLCESCRKNYKGLNITFEEAEVDRDRALQERWQRRHALLTSRAKRFTPPQQSPQPKPPTQRQEEKHGNGHNSNHTSPAQRRCERRHCRPRNCGPRGRRPPFGPIHHPPYGPHPPPFGPCGPPPGPPPPFFFPPCGPPPDLPPHAPPPIHPPPSAPQYGPDDLALKEAIRRSMEDLMDKTEKKVAEAPTPETKDRVAPAHVVTVKEEPTPVLVVGTEVPAEVESAPDTVKEEPSNEHENKGASFASDAEGCGDVAEGLGEALDKVAVAIDSLNLELNRTPPECDSEMNSDDEPEIVVDVECAVDSAPNEAGATIVEGDDTAEEVASQNSWQVVTDARNQITQDEALARAAQVIGSALFNSDVSPHEEVQDDVVSTLSNGSAADSPPHGSFAAAGSAPSADMVSSVTSVPSTIPSIGTSVQVTPAQRDRWVLQLEQLHELGFYNDAVSVEILERLTAANIGVEDSTSEVNVERVVNEMMKDW